MNKALHYLHEFAIGNPGALAFVAAVCGFTALALFLTPLFDEKFDKQMEEQERKEDECRRYPLSELEELDMMYHGGGK